ncbi:MAG TPA: D-glycero-beta-D-manno-heptose-7-phosphate kinase, partial [Gemmatimonadaceae bacterium]|nr:D-glycero-beta-D-manno-heptose-7-phosphate kinase [Gemmatimonadaceae bacterium]
MRLDLSAQRLADLLARAATTRIAVIGDAMLDVYLTGDVERISPEAPVPVLRVRERKHALGGAANVAQNVVAIGAGCALVSAIGADRAGETLRTMLRESGVTAAVPPTHERCTTQKTRIVARSQQVVRVDEEEDGELAGADVQAIIDAAHAAIATADALVLEDYNKGVLTPTVIRTAIDEARRKGIPIVVDPKYRNFFAYRGATLFKPNRRELETALGAAVDFQHPESLSHAFERLGVEHLLLTLSERGMVMYSAHGEVLRVPALAREVYDVVGAGDTVTAYVAAMLAAGGSMPEAAMVANLAAGLEGGKFGAATVSPAELIEFAGS